MSDSSLYVQAILKILQGSNPKSFVTDEWPPLWQQVAQLAHQAGGIEALIEAVLTTLNGQAPEIIEAIKQEFENPSGTSRTSQGWFTIADAYAVSDVIRYIVDQIILENSLSLFFGPPGSLKSMILMYMALCVALGIPFLPARPGDENTKPFATMKSRVLWLDMDNGRERLMRRVKAMARGLGIPADFSDFKAISFPNPPFVANEQKSIDWLGNEAVKFGAKLIIVDNLLAVSGGVEENSSKMLEVMLGLRYVVEGTGASLITLHHPLKHDEEMFRGHSSILQALDLMVSVKRNLDTLTFTSGKDRDFPMPSFGAIWEYETVDMALKWGRFFGIKPSYNPAMREIMKFVEANPGLNQSQICEELSATLKLGKPKIRADLLYLVENTAITEKDGPVNNTKLYYTTQSIQQQAIFTSLHKPKKPAKTE